MNARDLSTGAMITVGAGVLLFVDGLLPWFRTCFEGLGINSCVSGNAWDKPFSLLAMLLTLALVAEVIAVQLAKVTLPDLGSVTWGQVRLGASVAVLALIVLQLLIGADPLSRYLFLYLGVVLAAALLYGTVQRNREAVRAPASAPVQP